MQDVIAVVGTLVFSYLLGSINFAIVVTKIFIGEDIRNHGSGNAGMTNVLRTVGKKAAFFTLLGDLFKGIIPVFLATWIFGQFGEITPLTGGYLAGFAALVGHIFPIFYGFRGGKGLLTAAGVMIAIDFFVFLPLLFVFLVVAFSTKIVSLATIIVAIVFPFCTYFVQTYLQTFRMGNLYCSIAIAAIVLVMHRQNMKRLIHGTENKFGEKK